MAKILLLDDERLTQVAIQDILQTAGHEVIVRGTAWGTSKLIYDERPDLVLLDLVLPTISGEDFLDLVRKSPELRHTKVVLYSSRTDIEDVAQEHGADGFIRKGRLDELLAEVTRFLPP
jgi:DNA-binding response OmpR family regulator